MVRVIFFDFYSVWIPDRYQEYLNYAQSLSGQEYAALSEVVEKYYRGEVNLEYLADVFRLRLGRMEVDKDSLTIHESDISPDMVNLLRALHEHFLKPGILANLGMMELGLLMQTNSSQPLLEFILSPLSLGVKLPLLSQEVFSRALQEVGEPPASCVVVSGHDDYLAYAAKYGMQTIKFTNLGALVQSLGELLAKDVPSFVNPL